MGVLSSLFVVYSPAYTTLHFIGYISKNPSKNQSYNDYNCEKAGIFIFINTENYNPINVYTINIYITKKFYQSIFHHMDVMKSIVFLIFVKISWLSPPIQREFSQSFKIKSLRSLNPLNAVWFFLIISTQLMARSRLPVCVSLIGTG